MVVVTITDDTLCTLERQEILTIVQWYTPIRVGAVSPVSEVCFSIWLRQ